MRVVRPLRHRPALSALGLALALALVALPVSPPAWAQSTPSRLPALGDAVGDELGASAERRLGDRIMVELRRDPDMLEDAVLADYLQSIWQPLRDAARQRGDIADELNQHFAWELFLVRDRSVNAFALPGGYLGVHLGLIGMTASRDELASVLAHELSHVTQRHIARMLSVGRRQSAIGIATLILGIMAASRSPDAAQALVLGGQAAAAQGQLNFSRDMEREADRVGFGVLEGAGYAGIGMVGMFERLQQASRLTDSNQFPYLRSHPLSTERMAEARSRLGLAGATASTDDASSGGATAVWLHAAMQGRAKALMDGRAESLQRLAAGAHGDLTGPAGLTQAYAAALAATRLKDTATADRALARLQRLAAPYPAVQRVVLAVQLEAWIDRGRGAEAQALLDSPAGLGLMDGSRAGLMLAAQVALSLRGPAAPLNRSAQDLQTWLALHPVDAAAWDALARVLDRLGAALPALRAHAEARWALGDLSGAADRLRAAQRLARETGQVESVDATIIESRLKAVEILRRQRLAEERGTS